MNLEIANRLVRLRKENNMSQEELAAKIGISRQAVSKWERAEASPDTDNLILLARLYQISLDELLSTSEPVESLQAESESDPESASGENAPGGDGGEKTIEEAEEEGQRERRRKMWLRFPYPIFITVIYFLLGYGAGMWRMTWLLFLTIPLYYWAAAESGRWQTGRQTGKNKESSPGSKE